MNRLLIIGAGGFGRELLAWALDVARDGCDWEIEGFLDDNPTALEGFSVPYPILGSPLDYQFQENDRLLCAIGSPETKLNICNELEKRGGKFITLTHPTAIIGTRCKIGAGSILCPGTILTSDVTIGRHVILNLQVTVGHDAVIGDGCTLSPHSDVTGYATLGKGVFMGAHAVVLPNARVEDFAVVGAGSVVLKKVKAGSTVLGVPAKQISGF